MAQLVKNPPANAGYARDVILIFRLGRFPGEGNGNLLKYSCLENSMDRGACQAIVHGVAKSRTRLSTHAPHGGYEKPRKRLHPGLRCTCRGLLVEGDHILPWPLTEGGDGSWGLISPDPLP